MNRIQIALATLMLFGLGCTNQNPNDEEVIESTSMTCTVSYTNSYGVTFTATANSCAEAYEEIRIFIEAK